MIGPKSRTRRASYRRSSIPIVQQAATYCAVDPISYYLNSSRESVDVKETKEACLARLTILELIALTCPEDASFVESIKPLNQIGLREQLVACGLSIDARGTSEDIDKLLIRDRVSHHMLRIGFGSMGLDKRVWFVIQERRLFMYRLWCNKSKLSQQDFERPIDSISMLWTMLEGVLSEPMSFREISIDGATPEDDVIISAVLQQIALHRTTNSFCTNFWSIREDQVDSKHLNRSLFEVSAFSSEMSFFIRYRQCVIKNGRAFISRLLIPMLIFDRFSIILNNSMDQLSSTPEAKKKIDDVFAHPQFGPYLRDLLNSIASNQPNTKTSTPGGTLPTVVTADMIPSLVHHMPFCARRTLGALEKQKHLKHPARLQVR
eukprot:GHVH01001153.1.p1 GENE.GHVH01001153.1~~GHVH01001153.1.p1  ORF type:complete len:376 (+),score=41.25 GHVH01001153.1:824-1951(+)